MAHERLSPEDRQLIKGCLNAIASEVFIDAEEFEAVSGASWEALRAVRAAYPEVDDDEQGVEIALHGAMLSLLFYPHRQEARWHEFVPGTAHDVFAVHQRWMQLKGWRVPEAEGGPYFFELLR
ncbi:hypothetical protein [Deinococcus maricopensis]|uniref:hypothetical protein n=1 Tax=Deinococcus maricopensis TaxID=309887 RepID=UPI0011D2B8AE|nr:hypothetical protein [Deinococcus maricopensis]